VQHKKVNNIVKELAKKHGLSVKETEKIVSAPWATMAKAIKESDPLDTEYEKLPVFKHINLGQFSYSNKKIKNSKKAKENGSSKKERKSN
jgi:hypothetical protein